MKSNPSVPLRKEMIQILVIDDDDHFRSVLTRHLQTRGFEVKAAATGEVGLKLAQDHRPDLIFLDLCLSRRSRLSGGEALRALKGQEATRSIPVVAMFGVEDSPEDEAGIRAAGAEEFMSKAEITFGSGEKSAFARRISALLMLNRPQGVLGSISPAFSEGQALSKGKGGIEPTVLVIDDDREIAELLKFWFDKQGLGRVLWAGDGAQGLRMAAGELPDLVILDLVMEGLSGQEVCRRLREQEKTFYLPILVLTADARIRREVDLIELGADDYLVKPANMARLTAKVRSLIRRCRLRASSRGVIQIGAAALDSANNHLNIGEESILLTPTESALLTLLMSAADKCVDKKILFKKIYHSWPAPTSSVIKAHVKNIRRKLGDRADLILSQGRQGYRFNVHYAVKGK